MAEELPEGFEVEAESEELPEGFAIDKPETDAPARKGVIDTVRDTVTDAITGAVDWYTKQPSFIERSKAVDAERKALLDRGELTPENDPGVSLAREVGLGFLTSPLRVLRPAKPAAPSAKELKAATDTDYEIARGMGVSYRPDAVKSFATDAEQFLNDESRFSEIAPLTHALLKKIQGRPDDPVSLGWLDTYRKRLNGIAKSPNREEAGAALIVMKRLDDFLDTADPRTLAVRPGLSPADTRARAEEAARIIRDARGNAAAGFRSDRLTGLEDTAELRAAASGSGMNLGNAVRQRLATLLSTDEGKLGFSPAELEAMRQVVEGTATGNTLRRISNWFGGGGGIGQSVLTGTGAATGALTGGLPGAVIGAIPGVTGTLSRVASNRMTAQQLKKLEEGTRARSPLAVERAATSPARSDVRDEMGLLLRLLIAEQYGIQPEPVDTPNVTPNVRHPGRPRKIDQDGTMEDALNSVIGRPDTYEEIVNQ